MASFDLVLTGGRVLDFESGLDGVRDIGVLRGRIAAVEEHIDPVDAGDVIDLAGRWVMPGHIDTHVHVAGATSGERDPTIGLRQLVEAGVTTALDLGGHMDVLMDGLKRHGGGITVGSLLILRPGHTIPDDEPAPAVIRKTVSDALAAGSLGVKMTGGYYPFSPSTTAGIISACNQAGAYVAFHVGTKQTGSRLDGLREVPHVLGRGRLHIAHINAYCRGSILPAHEEVQEALEILESMRGQVVSEVHMAIPNFTRGLCGENGYVLADVARNCLRLRGYETTDVGIRKAIRDGFGSVVVQRGGRMRLISGEEGMAIFDEARTDVGLSFPVNRPDTAFNLTAARREDGSFIVDAVASDGGALPRNVNIQQTMAMVRFGALSPLEMVAKLSYNPSRMVGLLDKGRIAVDADADFTVIDPERGRATMGIAAGTVIMVEGRAVGSGGRLLVTAGGERVAKASGLPYTVLDLSRSKLYEGYR